MIRDRKVLRDREYNFGFMDLCMSRERSPKQRVIRELPFFRERNSGFFGLFF